MLATVPVADAFVAIWKDVKVPDGRDRIVRHGPTPGKSFGEKLLLGFNRR